MDARQCLVLFATVSARAVCFPSQVSKTLRSAPERPPQILLCPEATPFKVERALALEKCVERGPAASSCLTPPSALSRTAAWRDSAGTTGSARDLCTTGVHLLYLFTRTDALCAQAWHQPHVPRLRARQPESLPIPDVRSASRASNDLEKSARNCTGFSSTRTSPSPATKSSSNTRHGARCFLLILKYRLSKSLSNDIQSLVRRCAGGGAARD